MNQQQKIELFVFILLCANIASCQKREKVNSSDNGTQQSKTESFQFSGNYVPSKPIKFKDQILKTTEIATGDSLGRIYIKSIILRFGIEGEGQDRITYASFNGSKDNFSIITNDPVFGGIKISGKFLGEKGPMKDNIEFSKTIVFKGMISINGTSEKLDCTYFDGD